MIYIVTVFMHAAVLRKSEVMKLDFLIKAQEWCCVLEEPVYCCISLLELAAKVAKVHNCYTHTVEMNYRDIVNSCFVSPSLTYDSIKNTNPEQIGTFKCAIPHSN